MSKYRFKTKEEFVIEGLWIEDDSNHNNGYPGDWCSDGNMNKYIGQDIPDRYNSHMDRDKPFNMDGWSFEPNDYVLNKEINIEETLEQLKQLNQLNQNSLKTKEKMTTKTENAVKNPVSEKFVFMDKTVSVLNVGFSTAKNVILYGPGE
jgi:hypothetical protein